MRSNAMKDAPNGAETDALHSTNAISMIGHVQVLLEAKIGTVTMTVERLFGLKNGDVVEMNEILDAPMTLLLNGKPVARGELMAVDDHFGVRILDLV
jgi:flagellar motor switch protein FliN